MRMREFVKASISDFDETMNLIPAAVLALPGYGWSAGSVYNEVDWENKKYIQRVEKIAVTASDVPAADSGFVGTGSGFVWIRNFKLAAGGTFATYKSGGFAGLVNFGEVDINNSNYYGSQWRTRFFGATDRDDLLAKIGEGVDLYYELATPIETDISALIDDNVIEVESGGSLTFENTNGDSYRIPVPSSVVTMEKP